MLHPHFHSRAVPSRPQEKVMRGPRLPATLLHSLLPTLSPTPPAFLSPESRWAQQVPLHVGLPGRHPLGACPPGPASWGGARTTSVRLWVHPLSMFLGYESLRTWLRLNMPPLRIHHRHPARDLSRCWEAALGRAGVGGGHTPSHFLQRSFPSNEASVWSPTAWFTFGTWRGWWGWCD